MVMMKRLIALGLSFCSLALCACQFGKKEEVSTEDTVKTEASTEAPEVMFKQINDDLPAKMDFGGELINIAVRGDARYNYEFIVDGGAANTGVVSQAIYKRNVAVEERLNVMVQYSPMGGGHGPFENIEASILGGIGAYDIAIGSNAPTNLFAVKGQYRNLRNIDNLNLSKGYWSQGMLENSTYADTTFFATGAISTYFYDSAYVIYFNKNLCTDWGIDSNTVYDIVLNGDWTLEQMISLTKDIYSDANQNGVVDDGDVYGFGLQVTSAVDGFSSSCGITMTEIVDNKVVYALDVERNVNVVEKLADFVWNNEGVVALAESNYVKYDDVYLFEKQFVNDQLLFVTDWLYSTSDSLRTMNSDFGVLPYPKYSESEEYTTYVHDKFSVVGIPISVEQGRVEMLGAFLEAMASGGQNTVMPAYYERALTGVYIRDVQSVQTMDIIVGNMKNDRIWFLDNTNCHKVIRAPIRDKAPNTVVSTYNSIYDLVNQNINKIYDTYAKYSGN